MAHTMTRRSLAEWAELDDLVAEEFGALDRRQEMLERSHRPGEAPAPDRPGDAGAVMPSQDIADEPIDELNFADDGARLLAVCRILGTADDPYALVERLSVNLPSPTLPSEDTAQADAVLPEPGDV